MSADEVDNLSPSSLFAFVLANHMNEPMFKDVAELIESDDLATAPITGVDSQYTSLHRLLQEKLAQIPREDLDSMRLGSFGQVAS